jgi:L-malate glycosyltransferase
MILTCDHNGGTELMTAALLERADPHRVRFDLVTLASPGPILERVRSSGVHAVSLGGAGLPRAFLRLAWILRQHSYDVVIAAGLKASLGARLIVRSQRRSPVFVCGVRGLHVTEAPELDSPKARLASALERIFSPLVDIYDANSTGAIELLASLGIDRRHLRYIPNGLDLVAWPSLEPSHATDPMIACVARFVPRKRHEDLLRALAILHRRNVSFRAVLAGEGPILEAMRSLACELGVNGIVEFPGDLDNRRIRLLLGDALLLCLPSTSEGMPGSVMEAMASSRAVIATDVPGTRDLVSHGETGLLVPAHSPAALADALERLLGDRELALRQGEAGRRRMESEFSLEQMVARKESLLIDAAAGRVH